MNMNYEFKTWKEAEAFFRENILPTLRNEDGLTAKDLFDIWAEDEAIEVAEAKDTEDSDYQDSLTMHK